MWNLITENLKFHILTECTLKSKNIHDETENSYDFSENSEEFCYHIQNLKQHTCSSLLSPTGNLHLLNTFTTKYKSDHIYSMTAKQIRSSYPVIDRSITIVKTKTIK